MNRVTLLLAASLGLVSTSTAFADVTFHFVVMAPANPELEAPKYEALSAYLKSANPLLGEIKLTVAKNYPEAARLFAAGDVEGMFSGSFVAAVFIAKGLAKPVVRPLAANGTSTYRTTIVAKEGVAPFAGIVDFKGKRVAYCRLTSAGEVFAQSLLARGVKPESVFTPVPVESHLAALEAVKSGAADYAVVKNKVFVPEEHPGLIAVGSDAGEHPDNTLIMTNMAFERSGALISRVLLNLEGDKSEKAQALKKVFGCRGFIATTGIDFVPTFTLLRKAHVDPKTFDFGF